MRTKNEFPDPEESIDSGSIRIANIDAFISLPPAHYPPSWQVIYHARPEDRQPQVHNEIPGRLKVCSKSVVFVPSSHLLPMLKFPLADCEAIDEWSPRSFQSALAAKQEVVPFTIA